MSEPCVLTFLTLCNIDGIIRGCSEVGVSGAAGVEGMVLREGMEATAGRGLIETEE